MGSFEDGGQDMFVLMKCDRLGDDLQGRYHKVNPTKVPQ